MAARKDSEEIKALNEEIRYLKTKAYQLITTNKCLKRELDQSNGKSNSLKYSHKNTVNKYNNKTAKCTNLNRTEKTIDALIEEIHYLKTKIYQLIATNRTLKKELKNSKNTEEDERNGWQKIRRRKDNGARTPEKPHERQRPIPLRNRF